jgi:hypothetical protein
LGATPATTRGQVPNETEVRSEIEHVLSSSVFRGSKRCHDFTNYVCAKTLQGASGTLKERTIAIDVFGRRTTEASVDDNIVRVGAREVRKRLALYYAGEGAEDPVRIELPTGTYVPVFRYQSQRPNFNVKPPLIEEASAIAAPAPGSRTPKRGRFWIAASAIAAVTISVLWLRAARNLPTEFDNFWQPAFESPAPILLVMPHPIVYHPSSRALLLDEQLNGKPELATARPINIPPQRLDGSDFVPVLNQYVGLGDAVAANDVSSVFERHNRVPQLRLADKLEFNDLYDSTVVLVGGSFSNRWTAEITKGLRYQFRFEGQSKPWIVDSQGDQKWGLAAITEDRRTPEDYILICRMPHAQTGKLIVVVAGLTVFGTEAGGRILSDPKLLQPILQNLPEGWQSRNLEAVMKVPVVGDGPALPSLVAVHTW